MTRKKGINFILVILFSLLIIGTYGLRIIPHLIKYPLFHDIASDYIGAQALLDQDADLYPLLSEAFPKIGIPWNANHLSTHPPTCYLLVLPLARLDFPVALVVWMTAMMTLIIITFRVLDIPWEHSILLGIGSALWPPGIWSLGQLTPIWLFGVALAYKFKDRPFLSGSQIAIASLPKFFAAPTLLYALWRKKWMVLVGFISVWLVAIGILLLFRADAISIYISSNVGNSMETILRQDNGAFLVTLHRLIGWPGIVAGSAFILYALWLGISNDSFWSWGFLVWAGISLLPIAWVYSLFPLFPWLFRAIQFKTPKIELLAAVTLILPFLGSIPGYRSWTVAVDILLSGILFILIVKYKNAENQEPITR